jgi:excinuclease UvrABC ATPase subunit
VSQAEGVLITGVYGSGKSSVAAEIAYLLERQEREAATQIATAEGAGLVDLTIVNDRPVAVVAQEILTFLGWP